MNLFDVSLFGSSLSLWERGGVRASQNTSDTRSSVR
jgi:hypothetical protein